MSSLTSVAVASLLGSSELPRLIELNSERLGLAYKTITAMLKGRGLSYYPAYMGTFVLARLAPSAQTWDDEMQVVQACKQAGVSISGGRAYHFPEGEKGWVRLNFALPPEMLAEALRRLAVGLDSCIPPTFVRSTNGYFQAQPDRRAAIIRQH